MKTENNKIREEEAIVNIDESYNVILPEIGYASYKILISALHFYKLALITINPSSNDLVDTYMLIDGFEKDKEILEVKKRRLRRGMVL